MGSSGSRVLPGGFTTTGDAPSRLIQNTPRRVPCDFGFCYNDLTESRHCSGFFQSEPLYKGIGPGSSAINLLRLIVGSIASPTARLLGTIAPGLSVRL